MLPASNRPASHGLPPGIARLHRRAIWTRGLAMLALVATFVALHVIEQRSAAWVRHSRETLRAARIAFNDALHRDLATHGYLSTGDSSVLASEQFAAADLQASLDILARLASGDSVQSERAREIRSRVRSWESHMSIVRATAAAHSNLDPSVAYHDRQLFADVRAAFAAFITAEDERYAERDARDRTINRAGLGLMLAETLVIALLLTRMGGRVREQAVELLLQQHRLEEQAVELEQQTEEAQNLAQELEISNEEMHESVEETLRSRDAVSAASRAKDEALAMLDAALASAPIGFAFFDRQLRYLRVNSTLHGMNGTPEGSLAGKTPEDALPPAVAAEVMPRLRQVLETGQPLVNQTFEAVIGSSPSARRTWLASYYPIRLGSELLGLGVVVLDLTERRQLEEQLRQSQKMEAIGALAGGIAHDFNNLLTAIRSFSELLLMDLPEESAHRSDVEHIRSATDRAAALTRQLLAFSRKQLLQPLVLDLNEVLRGFEHILRRVLGEDIECEWRLDAALDAVTADPGQIEQILMNLVVNARQAMPTGGLLTIETVNVQIDEDYAARAGDLAPGSYVMLAVSDTGTGMDAETQARIFEPFFTTKAAGEGTGLGLSTVYGIVKQSGGHVTVYSEPGRGTTFRVYLPATSARAAAADANRARDRVMASGDETILLVEDDPAVRLVARRILERGGYRVLEAPSPSEALSIVGLHPGAIDLVITDIVLPQMSGRELTERILALRPGIRVLFMSGYTDDAVIRRGLLEPGMLFLSKPFTMDAVSRAVRRALEAA